jgi:hypothetical protein
MKGLDGHTHIHTHIHTYTHLTTHTYEHTYTQPGTHTYIHNHTHRHTHPNTHILTYKTHTKSHIHTLIHTDTHTNYPTDSHKHTHRNKHGNTPTHIYILPYPHIKVVLGSPRPWVCNSQTSTANTTRSAKPNVAAPPLRTDICSLGLGAWVIRLGEDCEERRLGSSRSSCEFFPSNLSQTLIRAFCMAPTQRQTNPPKKKRKTTEG